MRPDTLFPLIALASVAIATAGEPKPDDDEHVEYSATEITSPPDPACLAGFWHSTVARRLNDRGEVVGDTVCEIAIGDAASPVLPSFSHGFRWNRAAGATTLPSLATDLTDVFARDINESGTTIGWELAADGSAAAPKWPRAGGVNPAFEPPGCGILGLFALGEGINDRGAVLGRVGLPSTTGGCRVVWMLKLASGEEFVGPAGTPRQLNNQGVGVGASANRAIRWSPAIGEVVLYEDPAAEKVALAWAINDRNEAVGQINQFDPQLGCLRSQTAAFWASNTRQTTLGRLRGDTHAAAYGISSRSQIVGQSYRPPSCPEYDPAQAHAVIWKGTRAVDLNSLVPKRFAREFHLEIGSAINDRGQIVVRGQRRGEPPAPCPALEFDPVTGENVYNPSATCQNLYSFLLTPKH